MKISIVSVFRDESKYLKEWIEFHLLIGVSHFHLVNNNSIDNYLEILNPYIINNIVTLYHIDVDILNNPPSRRNEQILVSEWVKKLNLIVSNLNDDWVIHVSTDEFIYPTTNETLTKILENFEDNVGEISINWTLFGNNNFLLKPNDLLIENLTKCCVDDHIHNFHVKPIFRPKAVVNIPSVHYTNLKNGYIKVDATGNPNNFKTPYEVKNRILNPIHINHYRLRDLDWTNNKLNTYKIWGRTEFENLKNEYNDIDNFAIYRFLPRLKQNFYGKN
jgi:hypothetical protein